MYGLPRASWTPLKRDRVMSNAETAEDKGFQPKVITGGKGSGPIDEDNWLSRLDKNNVFLYRKRHSKSAELSVWQIIHQWGDVALLFRSSSEENVPDTILYVDTKIFSNLNELVKVIYHAQPPQEQITNGDDNEQQRDRSD